MHYGVIRYFRDKLEIEFSESENRDIVKHLGAVNKSLRKLWKGNLPKKSDALTILGALVMFAAVQFLKISNNQYTKSKAGRYFKF